MKTKSASGLFHGTSLDVKLRIKRMNLMKKLNRYAGEDNVRTSNIVFSLHQIIIKLSNGDYTNEELDGDVVD